MKKVLLGRLLLAGLVSLSTLHSGTATASVADQCVDANTRGQVLRRSGKLSQARAQFEVCSDPRCPALVSADCVSRRGELEQAQPTVIFEVKDNTGRDLRRVSVAVDGQPLTEDLDGIALPVDPGQHVFTFRSPVTAPLALTLVIAEGVRGRHELVDLLPLAKEEPPRRLSATNLLTPTAPIDASARPRGLGTARTLAIVGAGASLVGFVAGGILGGLASAAWNRQQADCASPTSCPDHSAAVNDHNQAVLDGTVANAAFVAGGALLVVATVLFIAGRPERALGSFLAPSSAAARRMGSGLVLVGSF